MHTVHIVQHIISAQLLCMSLLEHLAAAPYVSCVQLCVIMQAVPLRVVLFWLLSSCPDFVVHLVLHVVLCAHALHCLHCLSVDIYAMMVI